MNALASVRMHIATAPSLLVWHQSSCLQIGHGDCAEAIFQALIGELAPVPPRGDAKVVAKPPEPGS